MLQVGEADVRVIFLIFFLLGAFGIHFVSYAYGVYRVVVVKGRNSNAICLSFAVFAAFGMLPLLLFAASSYQQVPMWLWSLGLLGYWYSFAVWVSLSYKHRDTPSDGGSRC